MKKFEMGKFVIFGAAALAAGVAAAETAAGRDLFLRQQAYAEMQRVGGQVDVLENNFEALSERVRRMEGGGSEVAALKSEIAALKSDVASVRREMQNMCREITDDLTKKISEIMKRAAPAPAPAPAPVAATRDAKPSPPPGNYREYVVESGDTLSLIAQAFKTSVPKLKEINSLRNDNLRIGQKLLVPAANESRAHDGRTKGRDF